MKTVIIVQARMTSTRLPGKILKRVLDKSLLEYQIERLRRVQLADDIVIATTVNQSDEPIIQECARLGMSVFRGSEEDVLSRYYLAAIQFGATDVVRITSDCPLIDSQIIDKVIQKYQENLTEFDYVSNTQIRSYPRGMDTEVFSLKALEEAYREANSLSEREHVTPYLYQNPNRFRILQVVADNDMSGHRWTVDTEEDLQLIKNIIEALYPVNPHFTMEEVLRLLDQHSDWLQINAHVIQKTI
ncbi:MAG: acylneuraminate cytidylyltransferase [Firmicutes bacterium HGW-Firmicutes-15]|nr:MAG: acylneuraminate cytidylyltransferase [Firmicutes bacterium HGW-Firmicutes-15]